MSTTKRHIPLAQARQILQAIDQAMQPLLADKTVRSVTVFERGANSRITITRKTKPYGRSKTTEFYLTAGALNYRQREYVKLCASARTTPRRLWILRYRQD